MHLGEAQMVRTLVAMGTGGRAAHRDGTGLVRSNSFEADAPAWRGLVGAAVAAGERVRRVLRHRRQLRKCRAVDAEIAKLVAAGDVGAAIPLARRNYRRKIDDGHHGASLASRLAAADGPDAIRARGDLAVVLARSPEADVALEGWRMIRAAKSQCAAVESLAGSALLARLRAEDAKCPPDLRRCLSSRVSGMSLEPHFSARRVASVQRARSAVAAGA